MKHTARLVVAVVVMLALGGGAQAAIIFSNVHIGGTLAEGASYLTGVNDIDFSFPDALVGDPVDPRRFGNIIITFEAESDTPLMLDIVTILGALDGSGLIYFNEVVEDLDEPGVIATHNAVLDENAQLPYVGDILFERASTHFKVKKTLFLSGEDSADFDLASVALIEQKFIPEPASLLALGLGGLALLRRR